MSAAAKSQGQAMYVVSKDDRLWLLSAQRINERAAALRKASETPEQRKQRLDREAHQERRSAT
jgi:hypothetical protein